MRVGPIAHGALLVAALGFAYQTWTREKTETPKVGTVEVWSEALADFQSFAFDGDGKSLRVEKRGEGDDTYYWGQVTRTEKKKKPKVPVKGQPGDTMTGQTITDEDDPTHGGGHGAPRKPGAGEAPRPPGAVTPGKPPGAATPGKPPAGAAPGKPEPTKAGGGPGSKTPQARSPHHAGAGPDDPAAPGKPGDKPPGKPGDKPAGAAGKPGDKPPAGASGSAPPDDSSEGEDEGEGDDEPGAEPAPPEETSSKTKEFPVGKLGKELISNLASLHALRDLGVLTDKQKEEYKLTDSKENLTVFFKGGKQHSLIIGDRVFGGGDRYVMNPDTGRGYVLSNSEIMRHIDGAESALAPRALHEFQDEIPQSSPGNPDDPNLPKAKRDRYPGVTEVEVEAAAGSHAWVRYEQADPANGTTIIGWADKQKPGESDVAFSNFLTQVERLRPLEYNPDVDASSLTKVMTVRYVKSDGKAIGTFELYKKEPAVTPEVGGTSTQPEYYVKTELTRVPGKVGRMSAERVSDDVPQLVGGQARPKDNPHGGGPADNPHGGAPDKTGQPKGDAPAKPGTPAEPASPKPAGSKPNPTEGNK